MIKKLALVGSLTVSSLCFGSAEGDKREGSGPNCQPKTVWQNLTDDYIHLMNEYKQTRDDDTIPHDEKIEKLVEISEEMRQVDPDGFYLNDSYNDCMKESNAQQRSDYDRCERNGNNDKCYDRADKNNDNRRAACERVSHSDNVRDGVDSVARGGGGGKKSGGRISAGDRRR